MMLYMVRIQDGGMRVHPLFTVKKAAAVLNVDKQFLRQHLESGQIRGEKRRVGEKEKWFIYHGEVDDLRTSKRLPQLLEKAERISLEGMGDMFATAKPKSAEIAGVPSPGVHADDDEAAAGSVGAEEGVEVIDAVMEAAAALEAFDIRQPVDQEVAFREQFEAKTDQNAVVYNTTSTEINGPFDHFIFSNRADALVDVDTHIRVQADVQADVQTDVQTDVRADAQSDLQSSIAGFTSEILNFDPLTQDESVDCTLAGIPLGDFAPEIIEKSSFIDDSVISFAVEDTLADDEAVSPITNPMLRGLASVTLDEVLQKLTIQFAQRIAEERNAVVDLRRQLAERDESLKLLPDLEKQLQKEKKTRVKHEEEVGSLKEKIAALEQELQQQARQPKPWWKKLLGSN